MSLSAELKLQNVPKMSIGRFFKARPGETKARCRHVSCKSRADADCCFHRGNTESQKRHILKYHHTECTVAELKQLVPYVIEADKARRLRKLKKKRLDSSKGKGKGKGRQSTFDMGKTPDFVPGSIPNVETLKYIIVMLVVHNALPY
ncbi:hypothetical protein KIPB_014107 [Kipferlia bialata]|uniref:Uncharacterized protein n=1 Tax=Kipferlia bialata TaxID=797122 RepID=A0A391P9V1_9EUKA|nr:hypothetical protein KIPB_014107 [Kipferlia bialata]|eukprot:g14107.t1